MIQYGVGEDVYSSANAAVLAYYGGPFSRIGGDFRFEHWLFEAL
jgi:hypothetical protein